MDNIRQFVKDHFEEIRSQVKEFMSDIYELDKDQIFDEECPFQTTAYGNIIYQDLVNKYDVRYSTDELWLEFSDVDWDLFDGYNTDKVLDEFFRSIPNLFRGNTVSVCDHNYACTAYTDFMIYYPMNEGLAIIPSSTARIIVSSYHDGSSGGATVMYFNKEGIEWLNKIFRV